MHRRAWPGVAAWGLWGLAVAGVATIPWFDHLLRAARRPDLAQLNASTLPLVLAALVAATVGGGPGLAAAPASGGVAAARPRAGGDGRRRAGAGDPAV